VEGLTRGGVGLQNASTAGMVGREFLAAMKPEAILVNAARGGLLQYEPVKVALESGRLGGLATDVMWSEPCDPDDPLVLHPRVIVTPHVAGVTDVSYATMAKVLAAEVRRLHAGHAPSRQLNPFP
jgi:phosphoglycerate dehydrogenase-like enzyme